MKATRHLKNEHEEISKVLDIIQKMTFQLGNQKSVNNTHLKNIIESLKIIADGCHHAKEAQILFPAIESKGLSRKSGSMATELKEHEIARSYIQEIEEVFEKNKNKQVNADLRLFSALLRYINLLRTHIEKENNMIFSTHFMQKNKNITRIKLLLLSFGDIDKA